MSGRKSFLFAVISVIVASLLVVGIDILSEPSITNKNNNVDYVFDEYTQNDIEDKLTNFVLKVYSPYDEEDIEEGIRGLSDIALEEEIDSLIVESGAFDENNIAEVSDIDVDIVSNTGSSTSNYMYYISFVISKDNMSQKMLLQFNCDAENKIYSHLVWIVGRF